MNGRYAFRSLAIDPYCLHLSTIRDVFINKIYFPKKQDPMKRNFQGIFLPVKMQDFFYDDNKLPEIKKAEHRFSLFIRTIDY